MVELSLMGRLLASAASEASSAGPERRQRAPSEFPVNETVQGVSGGGGGAWRSRGKEEREGRVAARPQMGRRPPSVAAALHKAPELQRRRGSVSALLAGY